jgi:large conductance mechanosensitive channel
MLKEFKAFVNQGNALDLAVGVLIGAAFGKIVNSIVTDIITPILSLALGRVNLTNLFVALDGGTYATLEEARKAGGAVIAYGAFLNNVLEFLIVAFTIFLIVRQINKWRGPVEKK